MKSRKDEKEAFSHNFRTNTRVLLIAFSTILILMGTLSISSKGSFAAVKYPDTLIIEDIDAPSTLDPASSGSYESFGPGIIDGMYESLITYGHEVSDLQGEIAESWDIASNGLSINFSIEPDHFFVLPETGASTNIEINAWIMKYSIDRTVLMADPDGNSWMLEGLIRGTDLGIGSLSFTDLNISQALLYLEAGGVEVVDDWTLRINFEYAYTGAISMFALSLGIAVNPLWIANYRPIAYTAYQGLNDAIDNETGMIPLDLWFPSLSGDFTKLGFPAIWNENVSGVVPSSGRWTSIYHEQMSLSGSGSGPYFLVPSETTFGQVIKLKKNFLWEGFVTGQGGSNWPDAPDHILVKTVNEPNTRLLDLQAAECDLPDIPTSIANHVIDIDEFLADRTVDPIIQAVMVDVVPGLAVVHLGMNQKSLLSEEWIEEDPSSTYSASEWAPYSWSVNHFSDDRSKYNNPFANYLFRQAFIRSFDGESFINQALNGFGIIPEGVIPLGIMGHHDNLIRDGYQPAFDPDGAKALFSTLGWKGTINVTMYEGSVSRNVSLNLLKDTIEAMGVGINIRILPVPWPTYLSTFRDSPIYLIGWSADYADPANFVAPFYEEYWGPQLNYSNPLVSQLVNEASIESNMAKRMQLYFNMEQNASLDYPFLPLYQPTDLFVRRDWVRGDVDSMLNPMRRLFQPWERLAKVEPLTGTSTITTTMTTTTTTPTTTTTTTDTNTTTTTTLEPTEPTDTSDTSISSTTTVPEITLGFELIGVLPLLLAGGLFKYRRKQKVDR